MKLAAASVIISVSSLILPAGAGSTEAVESVGEEVAPKLDISQFIDALSVRGYYNGPLDFNELTQGDVEYSQAGLFAFLGVVGGKESNLTWVPAFNYTFSTVDVETATPVPGFDESLHEITFPNFFLYAPDNSRWLHGAYANFGLRSDLGTVNSRDFFLAGAIGSAYQFNEKLTIGFGVYGSDLTNDPFVVAGPVFFWMPTEDWLISYYGPRFIARRELGPNARIGFEAGWNGGSWNVDSPSPIQESLRLDIRSIRVGLYYKQRIYGDIWGEIGAGYTFANELKVNSPGGRDLFPTAYGETDGAPYVGLGLSLNRW